MAVPLAASLDLPSDWVTVHGMVQQWAPRSAKVSVEVSVKRSELQSGVM